MKTDEMNKKLKKNTTKNTPGLTILKKVLLCSSNSLKPGLSFFENFSSFKTKAKGTSAGYV